MREFLKDVDLRFILGSFFIWRMVLFIIAYLAIRYIPAQSDFLGGGSDLYSTNPIFWGWANYDGEHYLSIAHFGYKPLQFFFFPVYPFIVGFFSQTLGRSYFITTFMGQLVSTISLIFALIGLWKLIGLDFGDKGDMGRKVARRTTLLLLLFPTSFYFISFYTESLFLALVVWSFYFIRKKRLVNAGVLGAITTATRAVGLALFPAFIVELWERGELRKNLVNSLLPILIVPVGTILYVVYLNEKTGDPLEILHNIYIYGEQRSTTLIPYPQVVYRYLFKILPAIDYSYFPAVFSTWLEFIASIIFGAIGAIGVLGNLGYLGKLGKTAKIRWSYLVYFAFAYTIPTLSGSFSSMSRYVLILFPGFILMAILIKKLPRSVQLLIYALLFICLSIATSLFLRGFWVA